MSDVFFRLQFIPRTYSTIVAQMAALSPGRRVKLTADEIPKATWSVLCQWRARLAELREAGWGRLIDSPQAVKNYEYARNCSPAFIAARPATRHCNMRHICPFCFARAAAAQWEHIDAILFPLQKRPRTRALMFDAATTEPPAPPKKIRRVRKLPYDIITSRIRVRCEADVNVRHILEDVCWQRRGSIDKLNPLGALMVTTVEPAKGGGWHFTTRYMLLVAKDFQTPEAFKTRGGKYFRRESEPSRTYVMRAVARTCRYPVGLLAGDIYQVMHALDACHRQRLTATFRMFRSPKTRQA